MCKMYLSSLPLYVLCTLGQQILDIVKLVMEQI